MPIVTFVLPDGRKRDVIGEIGNSIMQIAQSHAISEIIAECGGNCACGTCHIYMAPDDLGRSPALGTVEDAMLEATAAERRHNSRLACQIIMTEELDGIVVELPLTQI
jgi:ferredoxin, 2Fe-2S